MVRKYLQGQTTCAILPLFSCCALLQLCTDNRVQPKSRIQAELLLESLGSYWCSLVTCASVRSKSGSHGHSTLVIGSIQRQGFPTAVGAGSLTSFHYKPY